MASVHAYSSCIDTADLAGDGEWRLVVAGADRRVKVWAGTSLVSEVDLPEPPVALRAFYGDADTPNRRPFLAVAAGAHVYIYRNLRPYYKFTLPELPVAPRETDVWRAVRDGHVSSSDAWRELSEMKDAGTTLSSKSVDFLAIEDGDDVDGRRERFARANSSTPPSRRTSVTCMGSLRKSTDDWDAPECLYFGTEHGQLHVLESNASAVRRTYDLEATPAFVASHGVFDGESRISAACRDGRVRTVKNGELSTIVVELEAQPAGLVRTSKNIVVGCMNNAVHSYHARGKKNYTLYVPSPIQAMESLEITRSRVVRCLLVALADGQLRVYNDKHLVSVYDVGEPVCGLRFGRIGREDNALAITARSGAVRVRILPRLAKLEANPEGAGPPPEQDVPLAVPKKTKLYVEQTQREREQAVQMHRMFQRDLCKLRVSTARAYVKVLGDGRGVGGGRGGVSARLDAQVQGLGPLFKITVAVKNTGTRPMYDVPIMFTAGAMYSLEKSQVRAPALLPGVPFSAEVKVTCVDEAAGADVVRVFVCDKNSALPVISAVVKMPLSEFED